MKVTFIRKVDSLVESEGNPSPIPIKDIKSHQYTFDDFNWEELSKLSFEHDNTQD